MSTPCYHCGERCPQDLDLQVELLGRPRPMCCPGCALAAGLIADAGLMDFYRFRTELAPRVEQHLDWSSFDHPQIRDRMSALGTDGERQLHMNVGGLRCGACAWLIERRLSELEGVVSVQVDLGTGDTWVRMDPDRPVSEVMAAVAELGYSPRPAEQGAAGRALASERRDALRRIMVAGIAMMQVMSYAVGMYLGAFQDMGPTEARFFRLISLVVTTPVVFFSAVPFFRGALRGLRNRQPGMDLPVSLAVGIAYAASCINTFRGAGEVYFDSVVMFVFLLSAARYLELAARRRAQSWVGDGREAPTLARRLHADVATMVPAENLRAGDRIRLLAGDTVPADARIVEGELACDESLINGESEPLERTPGQDVFAGARCVSGPAELEVLRSGDDTLIAGLQRQVSQAQAQRPPLSRLADRIAGRFVVGVLIAAVASAVYHAGSGDALGTALAVLVVTCPCALSLAVPTALAAASGRLSAMGLMPVRAGAVERLAGVDTLALDKTGSLTRGRPALIRTVLLGDLDRREALALAAALEHGSQHPIARAFETYADGRKAEALRELPGSGLSGRVGRRRLQLGRPAEGGLPADADPGLTWIQLEDQDGPLALFGLDDPLREGCRGSLEALRAGGLALAILSGDRPQTVARIAEQLDITAAQGGMRPEDKRRWVQDRQSEGRRVAMLGDGINDGPVLATADLAIAMGRGAALARASADLVLPGDSLRPLARGRALATKTLSVMRQNLVWALAYNAVALPLAMSGALAPWMAAIGMSLSSLVVVVNAARLSAGEARDAVPARSVRDDGPRMAAG